MGGTAKRLCLLSDKKVPRVRNTLLLALLDFYFIFY